MREWLLKAVKNRESINKLLSQIDQERLSKGQIILTPQMIPSVFKILSDGELSASNVSMTQNGAVAMDVRLKNGMSFRYTFRIISAVLGGGRLIVKAKYTEEKLNTGLGGALLNLSGKSGLAFAVGKSDGIHVDTSNVEINKQGMPQFLSASFVRTAPGGLVFSVE